MFMKILYLLFSFHDMQIELFSFPSLACFDHRATGKSAKQPVFPHCRIKGIYNYVLSSLYTYLRDD